MPSEMLWTLIHEELDQKNIHNVGEASPYFWQWPNILTLSEK